MTEEGHDDDAPGGTVPGDWTELVYRVREAAFVKVFNPSTPLVQIGGFDALAMIGEGGYGIVFKARDPDLDRLVAIKLCRTCSQSAIDALIGEAKVLARLDHANIVTIHELGHHGGGVFFVMPYIGENAERFGDRDPPPTWQEVVDVYRGVARGLAAAHAVDIVHADVKPSNILLDSDDVPRVADFGLARRVIADADESEQDWLRHRAGTLYYMAPEVLRGEPSDALADQWSFFVSLCQTLERGTLPFHGRTSAEVLHNIEHTDVMKLLDPSLPAELRGVLQIGLSLDPRERFPDMATVQAELDRVRQTPPPSSPPSDEPEPDEPESDEPEPPDEHELMPLGEHELMSVAGESPPDEPELTPLGGGPARSKAKRGAVAASLMLVGTLGLTLGWVGRGRVEVPHASDPVPLPSASPCELGDDAEGSSTDIDPRVVSVCMFIRQGQIVDASDHWELVYVSRWNAITNLDAENLTDRELDAAKLAADTMIVVDTFRDQAAQLARQPETRSEAALATEAAMLWELAVQRARTMNASIGGRADKQLAPQD